MCLSENSPAASLAKKINTHARMVGVPRMRIRMEQADIVEDDEDEMSSESIRGGSSRKDKLVSTLTRLRPLLTNYNS